MPARRRMFKFFKTPAYKKIQKISKFSVIGFSFAYTLILFYIRNILPSYLIILL